jgi:sRNA-binding protein
MGGNVSAQMNTGKKVRDTTVAAVIALLAETFPQCFSVYEGRRRPLKIGIHKEILAAVNGALTPLELGRALGAYCSNQVYLSHTRTGAWRLDLDGNPAGVVTADEEAHAKAMLAGIRAKKEASTATAKAAAQPATPQPPKRLSLADLKAAALARKNSLKTAHQLMCRRRRKASPLGRFVRGSCARVYR